MKILRSLLLGFAIVLASLVALPTPAAHAIFIFDVAEVGPDVVVTGSGTLNITALTVVFGEFGPAEINPTGAILFAGPTSITYYVEYKGGGLTGPTSFGTGGSATPSSGSGSLVGIEGTLPFGPAPYLCLPTEYISGTLLTDSSTYTGQTFATLGFTPGTYTYTWGSVTDGTFDSLTVTSIVPEPSTGALLGVAGVSAVTLRRRTHA